ncbi:MAG: Uncharacterized protein CEN89_334 [Candidatus Berkelbacteria bacterium Licking1014_7]|uniref:Septum formation initiator n=1 Tax=Candidatus Berkelbacteria bacterium Licking1014_7 TaxID=2017147 RepID=A0A554LJZ1_9BACT|nr:MAG: Uncharacterized protein CEN89_334 [Candidatus Berkelbacteria bacterium Licking1014_7]
MKKLKFDFSAVAKKIAIFLYQLLILALVIYSGFVVVKKINENYKTNQEIQKYQDEIRQLKIENYNLSNLLIYYQTKTFKEIEARKRLGMKKEGETILVSPENKNGQTDIQQQQQTEMSQPAPNYQLWYNLIFHRERLPEIRFFEKG